MDQETIDKIVGIASEDDSLLNPGAPYAPKFAKHGRILPWLGTFANSQDYKVLEVGSRAVCSDSHWKKHIPDCDYTGFDVMEGINVDVVGDAHRLSEYFGCGEFDVVYSAAVFEHLAMPWIVAEEIAKVLAVGGYVCVLTHFSFSQHELPWHFFQFNSTALECLFNEKLGFEIVDSGLDNPMVGRFSHEASPLIAGRAIGGLFCHSAVVAKKVRNVLGREDHFDWRSSLQEVIGQTNYPEGTGLSAKKKSEGA